ncbi:MAG: cytidylyltransferase domain-containing protein [Cellvibrionaceae bacterium]
MIDGKRVLAIVPARSGSKGLADKNVRPLDGQPLLAWPIVTALESQYIDRVILSTDSQEYADIGQSHGAEVLSLRPDHLAGDQVPTSDVVIHIVDELKAQGDAFEYLVLLEPTSPLTQSSDVDSGLEALMQRSQSGAMVAIREVLTEHPLYCSTMDPQSKLSPYQRSSFSEPIRRQDLSKIFCFSGSFYISNVDRYRREQSFYHDATYGFEMPAWKSREIDDLSDFVCVEALKKNQHLFSS